MLFRTIVFSFIIYKRFECSEAGNFCFDFYILQPANFLLCFM